MNMAWAYVIVGFIVMMWPMAVVVRVSKWNFFQRGGKALALMLLYLPILVACFILGLLMLVLGAEVLKGTIPIQL
jgi:hypothetical protein